MRLRGEFFMAPGPDSPPMCDMGVTAVTSCHVRVACSVLKVTLLPALELHHGQRHSHPPCGQPVRPPLRRHLREEHRHLEGLASKMLGDPAGAEDVVQEAFGRLLWMDLDQIRDLRGWLTVVVRRLCLNRIRSAYARRESATGAAPPEQGPSPVTRPGHGSPGDPADRVTLDGQVQLALAVVLNRLTPAERTSFVLHDVFGFPYAVIGEIVGRTATACRQLASRARRTVRSSPPSPESSPADSALTDEHSILLERFIAACGGGDMARLLELLDPDVVGVATMAGQGRIGGGRGASDVAATALAFVGPGTETTLVPVSLEGKPGIVGIVRGEVRLVIRLDEADGVFRHIHTVVIPPSR